MSYEFFNKWAPIFMARFISDFGCSVLDAAAVFGNAGLESGGFKSLQEKKPLVAGSKGGYGIMQWTGPRRRAYEAYCKRNKLNPADMDVNYKYIFCEMKGLEGSENGKKILADMAKAGTLDKKVEVFMKGFLRPGIPHLPDRIIWAKRAYEAYQDTNVVKAVVSTPEVTEPLQTPSTAPEIGTEDKKSVWVTILEILVKILGK